MTAKIINQKLNGSPLFAERISSTNVIKPTNAPVMPARDLENKSAKSMKPMAVESKN